MPPPPSTPASGSAPIGALPRYWEDESSRRHFLDRLFDGTARDYDFVERLLGLGSGPWYRRQALKRAGLRPGMQVLDIATGTGLVAREALGIVGPTGRVLGLDPSAGMLEEAASLGVGLVRGLGERLPFADASFDFVSMGFALRHVANLDPLFAEMHRVLKPGGTVCVLELTRPRSAVVSGAVRLFMTCVVPVVSRVLLRNAHGARLMKFYWDSIDACVPPPVILAALQRSGLVRARRSVSLGMFSEYRARTPA